jgi:hypothetical protein
MKNFYSLLVIGCLVPALTQMQAQAQIIATYSVTTSNDANNTADPNDVAATQTGTFATLAPASDLIMNPVSGNNGLGAGYHFGYTVSANTAFFPTSLSGAETQGTYITFTVTPQAGATVNLTNIDFSSASFNSDFYNTPNQVNGNLSSGYTASLLSSADNFTADLGDMPFNATTSGTNISLGSSYSNITTPTEFRLYFYGTPDGNEAEYVYLTLTDGSAINVDGTVTAAAAPEPSTWAMMLGGVGFLAFYGYRKKSSPFIFS